MFEKLLSDPKLPESDRPVLERLRQHCQSLVSAGRDPDEIMCILASEARREMAHREALSN